MAEQADSAATKRAAAKTIAAAGAALSAELGLQREGSNPRYWFEDRGWWRLNVWFEPSGFSVKINLRIGPQYMWSLSEHATMRDSSRSVIGGVPAAIDQVRQVRAELGDDWQHL